MFSVSVHAGIGGKCKKIQELESMQQRGLSMSSIAGYVPDVTLPWTCPDCQRVMTTFQGYRMHRLKHEGVYQYNCEFCGKGTGSKATLLEHLTGHTGVRYFECGVCKEEFRYRHHWKRHEKKCVVALNLSTTTSTGVPRVAAPNCTGVATPQNCMDENISSDNNGMHLTVNNRRSVPTLDGTNVTTNDRRSQAPLEAT